MVRRRRLGIRNSSDGQTPVAPPAPGFGGRPWYGNGEPTFPHGGEGLGAMCDWLLTATGTSAEAIAVAIEVPHGPVVETLMER
jgi:hypothetical protein